MCCVDWARAQGSSHDLCVCCVDWARAQGSSQDLGVCCVDWARAQGSSQDLGQGVGRARVSVRVNVKVGSRLTANSIREGSSFCETVIRHRYLMVRAMVRSVDVIDAKQTTWKLTQKSPLEKARGWEGGRPR